MSKTKRRTAVKVAKDASVLMRLSGDDKHALEDAAARDGLSLSTWLRRLALRAAGVLEASA